MTAYVADELSVVEETDLQKTLEKSIGKDTKLDLKVDPSFLGGNKITD
ncbi:MAG: hypothetical protein Ct9H300mP29_8250 [Candidatus Neomarinimicrobiota bacterium]|nr:MAG: hypothetical protein Ct9H300mP29_8250 [Candidatus Neomarinimicrobiota bacterium]